MRTKTLLLTAALSAAGVMATMAAGVTSVNVVGYINVSVPPGFSFIANQLSAQNEKISALIAAPMDGTVVYTWKNGNFDPNAYNLFGDNTWDNPDTILTPGNGALIFNATAAAFTVTFVGEVKQGALKTTIPAGFSFISSQVPQEGTVSALGYAPKDGDILYKWEKGNFSPYSFNLFGDNTWDPKEPTLGVGDSALLSSVGGSWDRTFNVP